MGKINLDPYLFFNGNCREAMEFYKGVFGGELTFSTFGEFQGEMPDKEAMKDNIMHSMLDGDVRLMGSDSQTASPKAAKIELSLSGDDEAKLRGYFEGLSAGGAVKMQLADAGWGDLFGQLTDKYNIDWMVNITVKK
jgi:PhnB protein